MFMASCVTGAAVVILAAASCNKKVEVDLKDNTTGITTCRVINLSNEPIQGAVISASDGANFTTNADGYVNIERRSQDNLLYTVSANGYATMNTNIGVIRLYKMNGVKLKFTYAGAALPVGTEVTITANNSSFVPQKWSVTPNSEGEWNGSLPESSSFNANATVTIGEGESAVTRTVSGSFNTQEAGSNTTIQNVSLY